MQEDVLPGLKRQLAAAAGIFMTKERGDIAGKIQRTEHEISPYHKAKAVVSRYNREMVEWERKVQER